LQKKQIANKQLPIVFPELSLYADEAVPLRQNERLLRIQISE
jgi:hypothetical protein